MKKTKLSVRVNRKNANHHPDYTTERRRLSLNTRNLHVAKQRRDKLFAQWVGKVSRKEATA